MNTPHISIKWLLSGFLALYFLVLFSPADSLILSYSEFAWKSREQTWFCFASSDTGQIFSLIGRLLGLVPVGLLMEMDQARYGKVSFLSAMWVGLALGVLAAAIQLLKLEGVGQFIEPMLASGVVIAGMVLGRVARQVRVELLRRWILAAMLMVTPLFGWLILRTYGLGIDASLDTNLKIGDINPIRFLPFYFSFFGAEGGRLLTLPVVIALYIPVGIFLFVLGRGKSVGVLGAAASTAMLASIPELARYFSTDGLIQTENILLSAGAGALGIRSARSVVRLWQAADSSPLSYMAASGINAQRYIFRTCEVMLGVVFIGAGFAGALAHSVAPIWLAGALAIYSVVLWVRPTVWLWAIPAGLPILDFSPWTGQIYFDEFDCFLLVTLGIGFIRILPMRVHWHLSVGHRLLVLVLTISYLVSAIIGLRPLPPFDLNAFIDYSSNFNSLRLLKGFLWALFLLPLLQRSIDREGRALQRWVIPGLLVGLAGVSLVALWERYVFTGLMDFSLVYRITSTFPEMHTGGAALDAFLALTLPFILIWIFHQRSIASAILGLGLALIAGYTVMVAFARGLFAGIALSAWLWGVMYLSRIAFRLRGAGVSLPKAFGLVLLAGCTVLLFWQLFAQGGYRTFAAGVGVIAAALVVSWTGKTKHVEGLFLAIPMLALISMVIVWALPNGDYLSIAKGPYLAYSVSAAVFMLALWMRFLKIGQAAFVAHAALGWMAFNMLLVDYLWAGLTVLPVAGLCLVMALAVLVLVRSGHIPVLELNRNSAVGLSVTLVCLGLVIPIMGNWLWGVRFSVPVVKQDLAARFAHWETGVSLMEPGWSAQLFGIGLGRFPQAYYWHNPFGVFPSQFRFNVEGDSRHVRLGPLKYQRILDEDNIFLTLAGGTGIIEPLHYGQRMTLSPGHRYTMLLQARTKSQKAGLTLEACDKWLLYPLSCTTRNFSIPAKTQWKEIRMSFVANRHDDVWIAPTKQISIYNGSSDTLIDVDKVRLIDETGRDLIVNGEFTQGNARWFFSSDHHHLPWHAKNMWLHIWIEQGWFGAISFSLLLAAALVSSWSGSYRGEKILGVLALSLTSFAVVGMFDSVLDVPRISCLFFLLVWLALLKPKKREQV